MEADISALQDKLTEVRGGWGGGGSRPGVQSGQDLFVRGQELSVPRPFLKNYT